MLFTNDYSLTGFKTSKANQWDYFYDYELTLTLSETLQLRGVNSALWILQWVSTGLGLQPSYISSKLINTISVISNSESLCSHDNDHHSCGFLMGDSREPRDLNISDYHFYHFTWFIYIYIYVKKILLIIVMQKAGHFQFSIMVNDVLC